MARGDSLMFARLRELARRAGALTTYTPPAKPSGRWVCETYRPSTVRWRSHAYDTEIVIEAETSAPDSWAVYQSEPGSDQRVRLTDSAMGRMDALEFAQDYMGDIATRVGTEQTTRPAAV